MAWLICCFRCFMQFDGDRVICPRCGNYRQETREVKPEDGMPSELYGHPVLIIEDRRRWELN